MNARLDQVKEQLELVEIFNLLHPLTNFEVQNEPKFNGVYLRNNLPKIKNEAYVINLDEYKSIGAHWIALYANSNNERASYDATYFCSFWG